MEFGRQLKFDEMNVALLSPAEIRSNMHVVDAIESGVAYHSLNIEYNNNLKLAESLGLFEDEGIGKVPQSPAMERLDQLLKDNLMNPFMERELIESREEYMRARAYVSRYGDFAFKYVDSKIQETLGNQLIL